MTTDVGTAVGRAFAEALAAKDWVAVRSLVTDDLDFRGMTPGRTWEVDSPDDLAPDVLTQWFEPQDHIEELLECETREVGTRDHVRWLLRISTPDGPHICEQQAYYETRDGRISWLRVLCSGFMPTEKK